MQRPLPPAGPAASFNRPLKVFYCYAHEDERLRDRLDRHLAALKQSGQIDVWFDREIQAGKNIHQEIDRHLDTTDIFLILISPDFMALNYYYSKEMQRVLERSKRGEATIIPIILRPTDWEETPIAQLRVLPPNGKPITTWRDQDSAFKVVVQGIRDILLSSKKSDVIGSQIDFPFSNEEENALEFADNPDQRFPTMLVIDTSDSMHGEPIEALDEGLQTFQVEASEMEPLGHRMEVALVTFGNGKVQIVQPFRIVAEFRPPTLSAGGIRPMGEAIQQALDILKIRKDQYMSSGVNYWRPWVFLITSSEPSDDWQEAFRHIQIEEDRGVLRFFVVGLGNTQFLSRIATRKAVQLKKLKFIEMFRWIVTAGNQLMISQRNVGEFDLPPLDSWADQSHHQERES